MISEKGLDFKFVVAIIKALYKYIYLFQNVNAKLSLTHLDPKWNSIEF